MDFLQARSRDAGPLMLRILKKKLKANQLKLRILQKKNYRLKEKISTKKPKPKPKQKPKSATIAAAATIKPKSNKSKKRQPKGILKGFGNQKEQTPSNNVFGAIFSGPKPFSETETEIDTVLEIQEAKN